MRKLRRHVWWETAVLRTDNNSIKFIHVGQNKIRGVKVAVDQEFLFGQETITADMATFFKFKTPSGGFDKTKTMDALSFLETRIKARPVSKQQTNTSLDDDD